MAIDDGHAVSYTALPTGIPAYDSDEVQVGTVRRVLDNAREHIFDGLIIERTDGARVFVDAPEVARTAERAVTLTIAKRDIDAMPPHRETGGLLGRLFNR